MKIKTDYKICVNDHDFVEENGQLRELAVTITLCEYRNLIEENVRQAFENKKLVSEIDALKEENEKTRKCLVQCHAPEILKNFGKALCGGCECEENAEDNEEDDF